MGRIKTSFVKRIALELVEKYPETFTTDFSKNKLEMEKVVDVKSKRMRNNIAGYITSLKKQEAIKLKI